MKALAYRLADFAAWHLGPAPRIARETIAVFMVHGVHDLGMAARGTPPYNSLSLDAFMACVRTLLRRYNIISMNEAVAMMAGRMAWRPHCVVLTFDDSLKCIVACAASWLATAGVTATFYVSTEVIDTQQAYWWKRLEFAVDHATRPGASVTLPTARSFSIAAADGSRALTELKGALKKLPGRDVDAAVRSIEDQFGARLRPSEQNDPCSEIMSWDDVKQLAAWGMTVGSHSLTHPNLALLPPEALREELEGSRQVIAARTGSECRHVCYPYGACSDAVAAAARNAGYISGVTTVAPGLNSPGADPFRLKRFAMPAAAYKLGVLLSGVGGTG